MNRLAPFDTIGTSDTGLSLRNRFFERIRRNLSCIDAALDGQSLLSALPPGAQQDTGLSVEDLTGAPSHDPDLPFFLQSRFGRTER